MPATIQVSRPANEPDEQPHGALRGRRPDHAGCGDDEDQRRQMDQCRRDDDGSEHHQGGDRQRQPGQRCRARAELFVVEPDQLELRRVSPVGIDDSVSSDLRCGRQAPGEQLHLAEPSLPAHGGRRYSSPAPRREAPRARTRCRTPAREPRGRR